MKEVPAMHFSDERLRLTLVATLMLSFTLSSTTLLAQEPAQSQQPPAGSTNTGSQTPLPDTPQAQQQPAAPPNGQDASGQKQDEPANLPTGAAAAKAANPKGAIAAQPFGAAVAPPKQHQHRSLAIKIGLLAGGAVAVGSALALSKGSPSRPPGAQGATSHP